jgi:hypothetical protein
MRLARLSRRRPEPGSGTATRTLLPVRATYRFRPQRPSNSRREVGKGEPRGESSAKVPGGPERGQAGTGPSALRLLPGALHRRDVGGLAAKGNPDHGGRPGGPPDSLHRDLRHRPAYSTGYHEGESELASVLNGFGDRLTKYVLNLNGHSHDYERYRPIHGVVHITATGGGPTSRPRGRETTRAPPTGRCTWRTCAWTSRRAGSIPRRCADRPLRTTTSAAGPARSSTRRRSLRAAEPSSPKPS